ncbi:hypothetical protein QUF72_21585 [Desulfobacterales bacterium HSG2]|nr:hypothetical protein [Desulfobacterales bacterium HSG2]
MASNFRISHHKKSDNLHLKLMGDFDGSSAYELLNVLEENRNYVVRVFIHTGNLKTVYPFGREVFQNNLSVHKRSPQLIFTGRNGRKIAPD